ncbi:MAG: terminase small subunit [Alphaproteobacteria bacterium]|nr:terminase small subunit [Alphaproteobacteria bacterium]
MTSNNLVSIKKPNGRPLAYVAPIADKIIQRMINGECLLKICQDHNMPSRTTVYKWIKENIEGFSDRYAYARELMADFYAEEILEIADGDPNNDSPEKIMRDKLRIDALKRYVAKIAPRKYGERQTIEHEGEVLIAHRILEARKRFAEPIQPLCISEE